MSRTAKKYEEGTGGKRTNIVMTEDDMKKLEVIRKHLKKNFGMDTDTACIKRAIYFYADYLEKGIDAE